MIATTFEIPTVTFNGCSFGRVELTRSATKHFGGDSEKYFRYIVSSLHGQTRSPSETGLNGSAIFKIASATWSVKGTFAQSDYRESCFRIFPETGTIQFFHSSSIQKGQYDRLAPDLKVRLEGPTLRQD